MVVNEAAGGGGAAETFGEATFEIGAAKDEPLWVRVRLEGVVVLGAERLDDGAGGARGNAPRAHGQPGRTQNQNQNENKWEKRGHRRRHWVWVWKRGVLEGGL